MQLVRLITITIPIITANTVCCSDLMVNPEVSLTTSLNPHDDHIR